MISCIYPRKKHRHIFVRMYSIVFPSTDSSFSFHTPNLVEEGPSHGAYTLLNKQRTNIATTLKGRTSPYVYSGFQTNKFTEDVGSNVVVAQG